jgi:hypothetical protein
MTAWAVLLIAAAIALWVARGIQLWMEYRKEKEQGK